MLVLELVDFHICMRCAWLVFYNTYSTIILFRGSQVLVMEEDECAPRKPIIFDRETVNLSDVKCESRANSNLQLSFDRLLI